MPQRKSVKIPVAQRLVHLPTESTRRDPGAALLMERLGSGHPLLSEVFRELMPFQRYGVKVTAEMVDEAITRVEDRNRPRPVRIVPAQQRKRRQGAPRGRFASVDVEGAVVYYVRIGNRIKIGTSTNLRDRLAAINPEELMAVERGGQPLEYRRHQEFASLRTHGEWFRYEGALIEHVESLRQIE